MAKTKKYEAYSTHEVSQIIGNNGVYASIHQTGGHYSYMSDEWIDERFDVHLQIVKGEFPALFSFSSLDEAEAWTIEEVKFPKSILILKYCS